MESVSIAYKEESFESLCLLAKAEFSLFFVELTIYKDTQPT